MNSSPSLSSSATRLGRHSVCVIAGAALSVLLLPGCKIPEFSAPENYEWRNHGYDYAADARSLSDERYYGGGGRTQSKSSQGKSEHGKAERSGSRSSGSDSGSSSSSSDTSSSSSSSDAVSSRESSGGGSDDKGSSSDSKSDNSSNDKDSSPSGGIGGRERN
ncbi:hypothetical protein [Verrucomicrobium sp. BvORR034]|jgi:hypothetical protein|uniref:hypothetical protein n=1 Tax=Verrucomicrobium sp. BvORR034 TaxID=1396418 RepID=UPI0006788798|nr:hypothetical protein [Verrucomicrobium sp. BvORR034]